MSIIKIQTVARHHQWRRAPLAAGMFPLCSAASDWELRAPACRSWLRSGPIWSSHYLPLISLQLMWLVNFIFSGPQTNKSCVFPAEIYNQITKDFDTYYGCDIDGEERPWCSTKVDENGVHIAGQGNWGDCGPDCPTQEESLKPQFTWRKDDTFRMTLKYKYNVALWTGLEWYCILFVCIFLYSLILTALVSATGTIMVTIIVPII